MSPGARYLDGARMAAAVLWTLSAKPAKELLRSGDRRVTLSVDLGRVVFATIVRVETGDVFEIGRGANRTILNFKRAIADIQRTT